MGLAELTLDQKRDLIRDSGDREKFAKESLRVRDRLGSLVPMDPWPSQVKLWAKLAEIRARNKPVRLVILKTRRSGFTMGSTEDMFQEIALWPGRKGRIIADKYEPAGDEAFSYLRDYHRHYTPFTRHGAGIRLPDASVKETSPKRIQWGDGDIDADDDKSAASRISVLSAEAGDVGRGGGCHYLLGDELAFWRDASTTLTAVLNMVPKLAHTTVILQSTANGLGGEFYELCQMAQDPANESGWDFLFFGWLEHPLCVMDVPDPATFAGSLDKEERELHTLHNATFQQLAWRRHTIKTEMRGSVDTFHQEYPTTPLEAFLNSGRPRLDTKAISRWVIRPGSPGELRLQDDGPIPRIVFRPGDHGALTIHAKPQPGKRYIMGADPSEGKDVSLEKRGKNPDYSSGLIIDAATGDEVALLRARIRPGPFADYLTLVAKWYNYAWLVPEANNSGFIDSIIRANYPLECIYDRRRDPTDRRPKRVEELGFETTPQTRKWLIEAIDDAVRFGLIHIHSHVIQQECNTFVIKPDGKAEHMDNCHDDTVINIGLCAMGLRTIPKEPYMPAIFSTATKVVKYGSALRRDADDD